MGNGLDCLFRIRTPESNIFTAQNFHCVVKGETIDNKVMHTHDDVTWLYGDKAGRRPALSSWVQQICYKKLPTKYTETLYNVRHLRSMSH